MIADITQLQSAAPARQDEFIRMLELLRAHSEAANELAHLDAILQEMQLDVAEELQPHYHAHQRAMAESASRLETLAKKHPEWFGDKRSLKTLVGTLKFHASTRLVVKDGERTFALIEREAARDNTFQADHYIRTRRELDLEALEKLDDATLKKLRITRETHDHFFIQPPKPLKPEELRKN